MAFPAMPRPFHEVPAPCKRWVIAVHYKHRALEDVLEELVGEIVDETDVDEEELVRISRTEALADAGVDVREVNHEFNVSLPILEHRSLNGFILDELGYVPTVGEVLERSGVRIEIVEATETQVLRARLTSMVADGQGEQRSEG